MGFCRICKIEYGTDRNLKFHRLPKDEFTKNQWFEVIGKVVPDSSVVCSRHFSENDYVFSRSGQKRSLKAGSIPRLSPPEDSKTSLSTIPDVSMNYSSNENIYLLKEEDGSVSAHVLSSNNGASGEKIESTMLNQNDNSPEFVIIVESKKEVPESLDCHQSPHKKLRIARYPRDLGPEHFVRKRDYDMLKAYLIKQRQTAKRVSKRISRWRQQIIQAENLLSELEEDELLSKEAAYTIRSSLPNIIS